MVLVEPGASQQARFSSTARPFNKQKDVGWDATQSTSLYKWWSRGESNALIFTTVCGYDIRRYIQDNSVPRCECWFHGILLLYTDIFWDFQTTPQGEGWFLGPS